MHALETFFDDDSLRTQACAGDHPPLVVEVGEDDRHAIAHLSERIGDWDANLVVYHVGGTSGGRIRRLDRFCGDAFSSWDQDDRKTSLCDVLDER